MLDNVKYYDCNMEKILFMELSILTLIFLLIFGSQVLSTSCIILWHFLQINFFGGPQKNKFFSIKMQILLHFDKYWEHIWLLLSWLLKLQFKLWQIGVLTRAVHRVIRTNTQISWSKLRTQHATSVIPLSLYFQEICVYVRITLCTPEFWQFFHLPSPSLIPR